MGVVEIPPTIIGKPVESIGEYAFYDCSGLTGVTFDSPSSVTSIGRGAFNGCSGLIGFTIPSGVTSIGKYMFEGCTGLKSITIPVGIISIGGDAFNDCSGLKSVSFTHPSGVTTIGGNAFHDCTGLENITIPAGVTSIGIGPFQGCAALTVILVDPGNHCFTSDEGVLFNADRTMLVQYPGGNSGPYSIPPSVTRIDDGAFASCRGLSSITIPNTVTSIGGFAFAGCAGLPSIGVDAGHLQYVSVDGLLYDAAQTTLIQYPAGKTSGYTIPATVTTIGTGAFALCPELTSIEIPEGITTVGEAAFDSCIGLTSMALPESVTTICEDAFLNCSGLTRFALPSGVTSIGAYAFEDCSGLTVITIPDSVTSIGEEAFLWCSSLASVTLPSGISTIEYGTFAACGSLVSIAIPSSVTGIGDYAFLNCTGLVKVSFMGNAPAMGEAVFDSVASGFTVYYFDGQTGFTSPLWNGYPAVSMGESTLLKIWLLENGLPFDADLQSDPNRDGVSLLLAYALDLDPHENLAGRMPQPVMAGNLMSLTFHAGSAGVTYAVEASMDLEHWSTTGVTLSSPDANQMRTATVNRNGPRRFVRLIVTY